MWTFKYAFCCIKVSLETPHPLPFLRKSPVLLLQQMDRLYFSPVFSEELTFSAGKSELAESAPRELVDCLPSNLSTLHTYITTHLCRSSSLCKMRIKKCFPLAVS